MKWPVTALGALLLLLDATMAQAGARLDTIKQRGFLTCGVGQHVPGFSGTDAQGVWSGFDVDICKAIAAGIFGDSGRLRFKAIDTLANFSRDSDIDLVLRGLTWTMGREVSGNLRFGPILLYDGQGFLVRKDAGIATPEALTEKTVCVSTDAAFFTTLRNYFMSRRLTFRAVLKDRRAQAEDAFFAGQCAAMSADASELAEAVIGKAARPEDYVILPQQITKEPLAPLLRKGDEQFFDAVRWAIFALINAEELGITRENAERMRASADPDIRFFFAAPPPGSGGLSPSWTAAIVKAVGNYGEIYDRHLGDKSKAKLPRGLSRLWSSGGLLYAPPIK